MHPLSPPNPSPLHSCTVATISSHLHLVAHNGGYQLPPDAASHAEHRVWLRVLSHEEEAPSSVSLISDGLPCQPLPPATFWLWCWPLTPSLSLLPLATLCSPALPPDRRCVVDLPRALPAQEGGPRSKIGGTGSEVILICSLFILDFWIFFVVESMLSPTKSMVYFWIISSFFDDLAVIRGHPYYFHFILDFLKSAW
jgi:hypothetical protein